MSSVELDDLNVIRSYIDQWGQQLELAVKHVLDIEYKLCSEVFEKIGPESWMRCFAKIVITKRPHQVVEAAGHIPSPRWTKTKTQPTFQRETL